MSTDKTAEEIANKWTMARYRSPNQPEGYADNEFFELLTDEIKSFANQQSRERSISFAEWLRLNEFHPRNKSEIETWIQAGNKIGWLGPGQSIIKTTAQLYDGPYQEYLKQ